MPLVPGGMFAAWAVWAGAAAGMNEHSRDAGIDRSHFRLAGASLLMFEQELIQSVTDPGTPCCVCQAPELHRGNLTAGLWMVGCESPLSDRGAGPQLVNGLGWCSKGNARVRDMAFWARGRFETGLRACVDGPDAWSQTQSAARIGHRSVRS